MKLVIFLISFLSIFYACNNNGKQADANEKKFNKIKWGTKDDKDYPYRDKMLDDLISNVNLKGLKKEEVINMLGQPDRIDNSYLFYRIAQKRMGFFPLHTKTLVIKLTSDSTVEWRKIHE